MDIYVYFDECHSFIDECICQKNKNIIIHCEAGVSRSSTIVISYLMKKNQMSFYEAFIFVRNKKPNIFPNFYFGKQLLEYEHKLGIKTSLLENDWKVVCIQNIIPGEREFEIKKILQKYNYNIESAIQSLFNP